MYNENSAGKMLGNRYEILEKIGTGGMATVYKAKCHLLNRYVAIKVLRDDLKEEEDIVKKFHVESQAAAGLSHHNIVSIYDVGVENGSNYIVMEYVDGTTLKEYIKKNGALDWREACKFAVDICSALDHAHRKKIIHRDIKPHNILMTKDKVLKVADFGIARTVTSETMVAGGAALGSVHYISPEQARGGYTDERSDIYSMGMVLYEMLTGKPAFDGENPVMVAIKHLEQEPKSILEVNPKIPQKVSDIVMKAIKREQHARYQTAAEMMLDLKKVLEETEEDDGTAELLKMINRNAKTEKEEDSMSASEKKIKKPKRAKTQKEIKEDRLAVIFAFVTLAVIALIASITFFVIRGGSREVIVPNLINMTLEEAQKEVEGTEFTINEEFETETSEDVEEGHIISQDPGANQSVKKNTEIKLVISSGDGKGDIEMPDLFEMSYEKASELLEQKGLKVEQKTEESSIVEDGAVIRQEPVKGTKLDKGDKVVLYVSTGSGAKTDVPDLLGATQSKAESMLKAEGLKIGSIREETSDKPAGTVISQNPTSGSKVSSGYFVNVVLSAGKKDETAATSTPVQSTPTPTPAPTATPTPTPITKRKTLTITFPESVGETVQLKVVANGTVIHDKEHKKSEGGARIAVTGTKDAEVEIYLDGKLTDKKTITFD